MGFPAFEERMRALPGVAEARHVSEPFKLASRA